MEPSITPDDKLPDWAKPKHKDDPLSEVKSDLYGAIKKTVFILGITVLLFASARNSLTWHFERFWGASKYLYENIWNAFYMGIFGGNDFLVGTVGVSVVGALFFWLNSLFFFILDIFEPKFFMKYKIQEDAKFTIPQLMKAIRVCVRNQFIQLLVSIPLYFLTKWRGQQYKASELPTFHWVLFEICFFALVEEIGFYYSHRLMHNRYFYKRVHKIHHEWTAPISIISIYCHPFEHVLANILPLFMGPFILGSHMGTGILWQCIGISATQISHAGYHLPFFPSPESHDFHHFKFTNNFGVFGVLDRLHGTDSMFIKTKAYDRHIMFFGLAPANELFPDDEGEKCGKNRKKSS